MSQEPDSLGCLTGPERPSSSSCAEPWELSSVPTVVSFSLLTWNVNKWPLLDRSPAARRQLGRIRRLVVGFDIVCIQECWSSFGRRLRESFPHSYSPGERSLFGFGSGLLLLSRFPILAGTFSRFRARRWPDSMAAKGMCAVKVQVPGLGELDLVNAHLQAWRGPGVQERQMEELSSFVQSRCRGPVVLLAGDLNVARGSFAYDALLDELGLRDLLDLSGQAPVSGPVLVRHTWSPDRIDHLFIRSRPDSGLRLVEGSTNCGIVPGPGEPCPSDHHGLYARVSFDWESSS